MVWFLFAVVCQMLIVDVVFVSWFWFGLVGGVCGLDWLVIACIY